MASVIDADAVCYAHPDGSRGVDGVSLTVAAGERVAVLGANGSGKSTLQAVLGGLEPPDSGSVNYFGSESDPGAVRDRLSVLLQDPDDYLFNATVREDLEYGPAQLDVARSVAEERIDRLVDALALDGLLEKPPFRLSAGEKERTALAAALAYDPDVLLLDEPTSNLDEPSRERALSLLDRVAADGASLVTFTPDPALAARLADRVILLARDGTIATRGPTRVVLTDADVLAAHGLAPPPAVRLLDELVDNPPLTIDRARERLEELFGE